METVTSNFTNATVQGENKLQQQTMGILWPQAKRSQFLFTPTVILRSHWEHDRRPVSISEWPSASYISEWPSASGNDLQHQWMTFSIREWPSASVNGRQHQWMTFGISERHSASGNDLQHQGMTFSTCEWPSAQVNDRRPVSISEVPNLPLTGRSSRSLVPKATGRNLKVPCPEHQWKRHELEKPAAACVLSRNCNCNDRPQVTPGLQPGSGLCTCKIQGDMWSQTDTGGHNTHVAIRRISIIVVPVLFLQTYTPQTLTDWPKVSLSKCS